MHTLKFPGPYTLTDLPVELLIEICWQSSNHSNLLLVCGLLRHVICSTPIFWQSIYIGKRQCTKDAAVHLGRRLERGVECPLDVSIKSPGAPAMDFDFWDVLKTHRHRFRLFDLDASTLHIASMVLRKIFVLAGSLELPAVRKFGVQFKFTEHNIRCYPFSSQLALQKLIRPIPSLFPKLTTLTLSYIDFYIPYLEAPLPSLTTLILYGNTCHALRPNLYQTMHLLTHMPNLETLWCKDHSMHNPDLTEGNTLTPNAHDMRYLPPGALPPIIIPIELHRLTRMAVTVPGRVTELLHAIRAPNMRDLHLDGTRDEGDVAGNYVAWLGGYPEELYNDLREAAPHYPALRRLALVGVYLTRGAWTEILGCNAEAPPFPMLESVAIRGLPEVRWEVYNEVNDALIERYAREGRIALRRFAYTDSEPQLSGRALHQLIQSVRGRHVSEDVKFELELDAEYGADTTESLNGLVDVGIKVKLHSEPCQVKDWWTLGPAVDPSEVDSY